MTTDPSPTVGQAGTTEPTSPPLIAVLGAAGVGKRALIARLVQGTGPGIGDSTTPTNPPPPSRTPWLLDTKYYTAAVEVASIRLSPDGVHASAADDPTTTTPTTPSSPSVLASTAEAVVLVFDAGDEASFEAARAWATAAGPALDAVSIRLAVASKADAAGLGPGAPRPAWHGPAGEWAAEAAFEWVEAAAGAADEASLLAATVGADDDDGGDGPAEAVGSDRVREALAAHMWPGLERKPVPASGRGGVAATTTTATSAATATVVLRSLLPENGDDDGDDDGFASLLAEATAARDRIRALPDAERRAAAAAFASRLLAAMDDGEGGGGGGDGDSSDERE